MKHNGNSPLPGVHIEIVGEILNNSGILRGEMEANHIVIVKMTT